MATLTISLTEAVLARLKKRADEQGTTPEALAADFVNRAQPMPGPNDELRSLAGSWASGVDDLGTRHDEYLGQLHEEELQRGRHG